MAKRCLLLGIDPASAKFGITSLSTSAMALLEENNKSLGLTGQAFDRTDLAGDGPFNAFQ